MYVVSKERTTRVRTGQNRTEPRESDMPVSAKPTADWAKLPEPQYSALYILGRSLTLVGVQFAKNRNF